MLKGNPKSIDAIAMLSIIATEVLKDYQKAEKLLMDGLKSNPDNLILVNNLAYNYLMPIANHPRVSRLWIVRPKKGTYGEIPKARYYLASSRRIIIRFLQMFRDCLRLGRRKEVRAFIVNHVMFGIDDTGWKQACQ